MLTTVKPPRLHPGDTVAAISLSWGGPGTFPARYEAGKRQCEETFGVRVVPTRHALRDAEWLAQNPKARADDLMEAFADPGIRGVISTIGGDDSIRILRHLDLDVLRANPKVFTGYSDTTVTHFACLAAGLSSFYGPAIMAGFAENAGMHSYLVDSVRRSMFETAPIGEIRPNTDGWTVEHMDWADATLQEQPRALRVSDGWHWLQGEGCVQGPLIGGCADVLAWLPGTRIWPDAAQWEGAILFLETSEDAPTPVQFRRWMRHLGELGVFDRVAAVLVARPGGRWATDAERELIGDTLQEVVRDELGLTSLPLVANMDFGHTDPFFVLPLGAVAEVDCTAQRFSIVEPAVT